MLGCVHALLQQTVLRCGLMLPIAACSRSHALCPHPIAANKVQSNSPWEQNRLTVAKVATNSAKPSGAHVCAVCYKETQCFSRQMQSKQITSNHQDAKLVPQSHKKTEDIKGSAPAGQHLLQHTLFHLKNDHSISSQHFPHSTGTRNPVQRQNGIVTRAHVALLPQHPYLNV